jgi:phenylalanyl-tRNA synthetase beta chain
VERAIALGYHEIVEIPIVDAERDAVFRSEKIQPAVIGNPLAEDASIMRSSGIVSMVRAIEWNLNHGNRDVRLFEIGKKYELRDRAPVETTVLTLGATGLAREKTIHQSAREFSFADLKGDLDRIGKLAGGWEWQTGGPAWLSAARAAHFSVAKAQSAPLGVAGQLSRRVAEQLKLRQDVYVAELELEPLLTAIESARVALRFVPWPRYPAVERDLSLVLAGGITFAQVEHTIGALGIAEIQSIQPADLFRGGQIPTGKYSLMIRVIFQSLQGTLTDSQLSEFSSRIVTALEQELGATLRAN